MPSCSGTGPFVSPHYQVILWTALFRSCEPPRTSPLHAMLWAWLQRDPCLPWQQSTVFLVPMSDRRESCSAAAYQAYGLPVVSTRARGQGGWGWAVAHSGHQQGSRLSCTAWTWVPAKGWNLQLQPLPASCFSFLGRRAQCSLMKHFQPHPSTNCLVTKALINRLLRF